MKRNDIKSIIKEEIKKILKEDYQDKFKMVGTLITDLNVRPQKEVYSDLRAITGITTISSVEPIQYNEQDTSNFKTTLTVKVDGYPWITKGGFNRDKMQDIASEIRKVPGVKRFITSTDNITNL
jgi:hypothetical protein